MADDPTAMLERLEASARRITWIMVDLDEEELTATVEADEWSPIQILAHIKACDDIMTGRIATTLTNPNASIPNFDERAWAEIAGYTEAPVDQTLMALQRHRGELVWQLRRLPETAWQHTLTHATRGTMTLQELVQSFLEHEEEHVAQLEGMFEDLGEPDEEDK
jgi:uncharacterized damage-inducible protein DinB